MSPIYVSKGNWHSMEYEGLEAYVRVEVSQGHIKVAVLFNGVWKKVKDNSKFVTLKP